MPPNQTNKYIGFCLVWFYGISTIVGYLMLNSLYSYIYIYIYTNPSVQAGCDIRSISKSLTGLNSEFSCTMTGCLNKVKECSLPYNLPISEYTLHIY